MNFDEEIRENETHQLETCVLLSACVGNSSSAFCTFLTIKIHGHDGDGRIDHLMVGGDVGAVPWLSESG